MQPRSAWHATPLKHHAGKACMSAVDAAKAPSLNWAAIDADPRFQCLHSEKTRLLAGLMLFSILQDFALPIVAACLPEIFRVKVWGRMNVGILFALSKFIIAWAQTTGEVSADWRLPKVDAQQTRCPQQLIEMAAAQRWLGKR